MYGYLACFGRKMNELATLAATVSALEPSSIPSPPSLPRLTKAAPVVPWIDWDEWRRLRDDGFRERASRKRTSELRTWLRLRRAAGILVVIETDVLLRALCVISAPERDGMAAVLLMNGLTD